MNSLISNYEKIFLDTQGVFHKKQILPIEDIDKSLQYFQDNKQKMPHTMYNCIKKYTGYETYKPILNLLTHPCVLELCKMVFGLDQFKLEHSFIVETINNTQTNIYNFDLHGGTHREWNIHYYHSYPIRDIKDTPYIRSGQLTVGIPLTNQNIDIGGMIYMPGSHKTSYHMSGNVFERIIKENNSNIFDILTVPDVKKGDLLAFPESLIHGSYSSGKADASRVTLYGAYYPIGFNFNFDDTQRKRFFSVADEPYQRNMIIPSVCNQKQKNLLNLAILN